jgi:hypothetical protein
LSETALVHVPTPDTTQPAAKKDRMDLLQKRYERVLVRDLDIVDGMNRFAEIPTEIEPISRASLEALLSGGSDAQIKAAGWKNRQQLRAAFYGALPRSKWPGAMQAAHERVGMRLRKQDKAANRQTFNLNVITIPAPRAPGPEDKVVIVEVKDKG